MRLNHPEAIPPCLFPLSVEKFSSMKLVPSAKKVWGPLFITLATMSSKSHTLFQEFYTYFHFFNFPSNSKF